MRARYVVDTNVLIAASAADQNQTKDIDATPTDPSLRMSVWLWLSAFSDSTSRLVLDSEGKIFDEYKNKLTYNDYGIQVIMNKFSTCAVDSVSIEYDLDGHGKLPKTLENVIHDNADRKMVAAAIESDFCFGEGCIAFASDTDWHGWEKALADHGVLLEPIIEDWSRPMYERKKGR